MELPTQKPKAEGPAVSAEELVAMGVPAKKAEQTLKNLPLCKAVAGIKSAAERSLPAGQPIPAGCGKALFELAQKLKNPGLAPESLQLVVGMIVDGSIKTQEQQTAAVALLNQSEGPLDRATVESQCGVGVEVSEAQVLAVVQEVFSANAAELESKGHGLRGTLTATVRADPRMKWAAGKVVSEAISAQLQQLLGAEDKGKIKKQREEELKKQRKEQEKQRKDKEAAGAAGEDQKVTPWDVQAGDEGVDYDKLIKEFGCEYIYKEQVDRIGQLTGMKPHRFLRRGIFFSQKELDVILDCKEQGKAFYLYTGRGPSSSSMHLGHLVPFMFTQYLQAAFKVPLVIQMTDDEKFLFKEDLELDHVRRCLRENAKDIIALGFDPELTFMFSDLDYITGGHGGAFYQNILQVQKRCNLNKAQSIFGFGLEDNIGKISFASIQASPSFASSFPHMLEPSARCLIPCAIDQDPYFRMTRDIAPRMKCKKPALIHSKFFPAITGASSKMSSSATSPTTIFLTDTPDDIARKINKYAFSGASESLAEHKLKGANLEVDVPYQYLRFFLEDDDRLQTIGDAYGKGQMMTGEVKAELIGVLQQLVAEFQIRRAKVTEADVDHFMSVAKFSGKKPGNASSAEPGSVASLEEYLSSNNVEALLGEAANHLAQTKAANPAQALAAFFAKRV